MPRKSATAKIGKHVVSVDGNGVSNRLLTPEETAKYLCCSVSSLNKWRVSGRGPAFIKVGVRVRYRLSDIAAFIERETYSSTSQMQAQGPP